MLKKTYSDLYNFFFNYPTPSNLTNVWNFGILSFFFLLIQIVSGLLLSMYYIPTEEFSFKYVEFIMRETYFGWFIRYIHNNGASLFFFFVYLHLFRSLFYFSYVSPKVAIWNTGAAILVLMIAAAFTGYVLPWGQMSFWAATVITNMVTALPFFGPNAAEVIWGTYGVSSITLNRFYTVHFILPFVILFIMIAHFKYLHEVGSNNATAVASIDDKKKFHPYYTWKDAIVVTFMACGYLIIINSVPNYLNHTDNYIPADYLSTPEHIVPEWYFLPFYTILRSGTTKIGGIVLLLSSILILFYFPFEVSFFYTKEEWNQIKKNELTGKKSDLYLIAQKNCSPWIVKNLYWLFVIDFIGLGYIGTQAVELPYYKIGNWLTLFYFVFFFQSCYIHAFNIWLTNIKDTGRKDYPGYVLIENLVIYLWNKLNLKKREIILSKIIFVKNSMSKFFQKISSKIRVFMEPYTIIYKNLKEVTNFVLNTPIKASFTSFKYDFEKKEWKQIK